MVNRAFNDANQLIAVTDTVLGTTSYYYDNNGNMTQILPPGVSAGEVGELLYSFTQRNLLTSNRVGMGGGVTHIVATYGYDGGGNRIQQVDHSGDTPVTTTYTNDNMGLSQVLVADDGATQTANLYGLDLISQDDGTGMRTLLVDGLGSVRQEMAAGEVETTSTYNPYGTLLAQTGTSGTVYGYTGEQEDSATGLVYLRARYYNPALQVFMGKDPWRGDKMRPITQHGYAYGYNSPPNFNDPSGHDPAWCAESYGTSSRECNLYPRDLIEFGGVAGEDWTPAEKVEVNKAAVKIAYRLAETYNEYMFGIRSEMSKHFSGNDYLMSLFNCGPNDYTLTPREAFVFYYGVESVLFYKTGNVEGHYGQYVSAGLTTPRINVNKYNYFGNISYRFAGTDFGYLWATHELGHYFEARINKIMGTNYIRDDVLGADTSITRRGLQRNDSDTYGFAGPLWGWQQSEVKQDINGNPIYETGEEFADMFLGWNYDEWEDDPNSEYYDVGQARANFMENHMASWITLVINREKKFAQ